jgi:DNA-binding response OmpR family regulator
MHILIVEDEARLARHISVALVEAGHEPKTVHDGETAIGEAQEKPYDLILLDVMLPGMDGFETLRHMRKVGIQSRVLMLTARGEVGDRVTGLQLGADDYLSKPFAMQELLARIRALGRRYSEEPELVLKVDDLTVRLDDRRVRRGKRDIELSSRELTLLKILMREPGRVFTRTELCERVWRRQPGYDTGLVEVFVGRLRRKLGDPPLIRTVRHISYTIGRK